MKLSELCKLRGILPFMGERNSSAITNHLLIGYERISK